MRPTFPGRTPAHGAVPMGVIRRSLTVLDEQAPSLRASGATRSAALVERFRARLADRAVAGADDLTWTSVPDAADRLDVSEPTVARWINSGRLEGRKVGGNYIVFERGIARIAGQSTHEDPGEENG